MDFPRAGKMRWLYLLALAQLVGGPLVLLQVILFCKLTVHEAPRTGVIQAAAKAWHSDDFQKTLVVGNTVRKDHSKAPAPTDGHAPKLEKAKMPVLPWMESPVALVCLSRHVRIVDHARMWTPAWPQAPPGPPPRIG